MADHQHRLYHALWHATRNGSTPQEIKTIKKLSPTWGNHAPICETGSAAGEEFLYMHRGMIEMLNLAFDEKHLPHIAAWKKLPEKDDVNWPVPEGKLDDVSKTEPVFALMKSWALFLHDPEYLKGKSLSEVGILVEFSVHNFMHTRWATIPRNGEDATPLKTDGKKLDVSTLLQPWPFDDPQYIWLGAPYSAHVNPIFWKLHGWVDDTIGIWLTANGYDSISENCDAANKKCYQWRSTWQGALPPEYLAMAKNSKQKNAHSHHPMRKLASETDIQNMTSSDLKVVGSVLDKGNFRNNKFDQFVTKSPTAFTTAAQPAPKAPGSPNGNPNGDAASQGAGPLPPGNLNDPANFISQFGPCSR